MKKIIFILEQGQASKLYPLINQLKKENNFNSKVCITST